MLLFAASPGELAAQTPQPPQTLVRVEVLSDDGPVEGAAVVAGSVAAVTDATGVARLPAGPGLVHLTVSKEGFAEVTAGLTVPRGE